MDIYRWLCEEWKNGNLIPHIEDDLAIGAFKVKAFTDTTVVAKRIGTDYYHKGCAPENAVDVKASDEQEFVDPILDHTACLECGRWILSGARRLAYGEYCEQQIKKV